MSDTQSIRTAVVGCGYWGKNLVRNFAALSDLRVCCDTAESVRAKLAGQYPDVRLTAEYEDVLRDEDVHAMVLATPVPLHADMAIRALRAGKHVFVEKPMALSVADGERMRRAAEEEGRILMVGHLLEYHPAVEHLKEIIDRGDLGDVLYCYSQRVNLGKVRSDENALWSLAPHDISVALYLLGEEPTAVDAVGQAFLQPGVEDVTFVTMGFQSGRMAQIHVSWLDPHKARRLTIVGSRKMAVFDDMEAREKIRIYDKGVDRSEGAAPDYGSYGESLTLREGDILIPRLSSREPLAAECQEFLNAVATGDRPRSDGKDGLRVLRVLESAQKKLEERRPAFEGLPA